MKARPVTGRATMVGEGRGPEGPAATEATRAADPEGEAVDGAAPLRTAASAAATKATGPRGSGVVPVGARSAPACWQSSSRAPATVTS